MLPRELLGRLMLPVVRVGLLFVLTAGREVLRFGVNVALGLRAVPVVEGRFKLFWFKWRRLVLDGFTVLRVLLSRLLRGWKRCPLKLADGCFLSYLPL